MIERQQRLRFLVERDLFQLCRPLTASNFATFCSDRDVRVDLKRLESLERTGVFRPLARVRFVKLTRKIEYLDEGRQYRDLGTLEEDEVWTGATREEYAHFWFTRDYALRWLDEGFLWDPADRPFQPWDEFQDEHGRRCIESYYSPFQILPLDLYVTSMTCRVPFELIHEWSSSEMTQFGAELKRVADMLLQPRDDEGAREKVAFVCQAISNRYFPHTQGDRRTITVSSGESHNWKWQDYVRALEPDECRAALDVTTDELRHMHGIATLMATSTDPLSDWYDLVTYVALDMKQRLKGAALQAQAIYEMELMLRMFHHDLTGEDLGRPDEGFNWKRDDLYGEGVTANELRHLEFLTNRFHLNPRPKVILVVEGQTEEAAYARIIEELLGHSLPQMGIEIRSLGGVGEFEGRRADRLSALERFIEEYHYRQTIVFIVLDDEGRVRDLRERLIVAPSKYFPRRTMIHADNFVLWKPNFEFANFGDAELADALTSVAGEHANFVPGDVARARTQKGSDPLSKLYLERCAYSLDKPALGHALVELLLKNGDREFDDAGKSSRPVVATLDRVIELAAFNHQPITVDTWEMNQLSGYFGVVLKP